MGYTEKENPTRGIKKVRQMPRDYFVDPRIWNAVYEHGNDIVRDAMDLPFLTGQSSSDVPGMTFADILSGAILEDQGKTGKKLRIILETSELNEVIERIKARGVVENNRHPV